MAMYGSMPSAGSSGYTGGGGRRKIFHTDAHDQRRHNNSLSPVKNSRLDTRHGDGDEEGHHQQQQGYNKHSLSRGGPLLPPHPPGHGPSSSSFSSLSHQQQPQQFSHSSQIAYNDTITPTAYPYASPQKNPSSSGPSYNPSYNPMTPTNPFRDIYNSEMRSSMNLNSTTLKIPLSPSSTAILQSPYKVNPATCGRYEGAQSEVTS